MSKEEVDTGVLYMLEGALLVSGAEEAGWVSCGIWVFWT